MGQTTTSPQVQINNAAKDDTIIGVTFTIKDLLGNDPGGAAKLDLTKQFFFGDTAADQANQAQYLIDHGIVKLSDDNGGTYGINEGALDFSYFVQIGNKGTWSQADVDITAPVPHLGAALFTENFDGYTGTKYEASGDFWQSTNLHDANGWDGATAAGSELGSSGYSNIATTSGVGDAAFWLDTQNSIGPINLSHVFNDSTAAASDGVTAVLSFDIAKQDLGSVGTTDPDATFEFRVDNVVVKEVTASELTAFNTLQHFDIEIAEYADLTDSSHTLSLVDTTTGSYIGFAVDSITIQDWVI